MAFVGLLALGLFVGSIITLGLQHAAESVGAYKTVVGVIIATAFGGLVLAFLNKAQSMKNVDAQSFFMYPIGLLLGLMWIYFPAIKSQPSPTLRWGGIVLLVLITALGALLALIPPFRRLLG